MLFNMSSYPLSTEFQQLVKHDFFRTLGFAALCISEILANEEEGPNGELDPSIRKKIEPYEIPATHVTETSFGFEVNTMFYVLVLSVCLFYLSFFMNLHLIIFFLNLDKIPNTDSSTGTWQRDHPRRILFYSRARGTTQRWSGQGCPLSSSSHPGCSNVVRILRQDQRISKALSVRIHNRKLVRPYFCGFLQLFIFTELSSFCLVLDASRTPTWFDMRLKLLKRPTRKTQLKRPKLNWTIHLQ